MITITTRIFRSSGGAVVFIEGPIGVEMPKLRRPVVTQRYDPSVSF